MARAVGLCLSEPRHTEKKSKKNTLSDVCDCDRHFGGPRSMHQYSNMAPGLSRQTSIIDGPLGIEGQNGLNIRSILSRKPRTSPYFRRLCPTPRDFARFQTISV